MSRYIPLLRPASFATLPRDLAWTYVEVPRYITGRSDLPVSKHYHGIIECRELTKDEVTGFDLRKIEDVRDLDMQITAVAEAFAEVMKQWLSPAEFAEMKRLNETDPTYADSCCASHNYCDANMAMDAAMQQVLGREVVMGEDEDPAGAAADCELWNEAWGLARKLYLGDQ